MAGAMVNPVLLGFPDEETKDDKLSYDISKIGGKPDWIGPDLPLSELACTLCQASCPLICQIYAPLENSLYHRTLYIFACIQPACWNQCQSWKCFRGQLRANDDLVKSPQEPADTFDWSDEDDDDWGVEDNAVKLENLALEEEDPNGNRLSPQQGAIAMNEVVSADVETDQIQEVILESPDKGDVNNTMIPELFAAKQEVTVRKGHFCSRYLAVDEEVSDSKDLSDHERQLLLEYKTKEAVEDEDGPPKGGSDACYEKVAPKHGDVGFHKFLSVIQKNPGQVLRYCRDLRHIPLFLSLSRPKDLPKSCSYCGGPMLCEVQLLPTLIHSLKLKDGASGFISNLEFGNLLVFTCLKSCWDDQLHYRREQIWLEAEAF